MPYPGSPESQRTVWSWRQSQRAAQAEPTSRRSSTVTSAPARRSVAALARPAAPAPITQIRVGAAVLTGDAPRPSPRGKHDLDVVGGVREPELLVGADRRVVVGADVERDRVDSVPEEHAAEPRA